MKIPFPVESSNCSQKEIIDHVSSLVKLLIEKEIMIENKVKIIESIIENEMQRGGTGRKNKFK